MSCPDGACCLDSGDTAWVMTSAALVFIQTPAMGLAQVCYSNTELTYAY